MPDARTIELIQGKIDDALSPAERAELDGRLAAEPDAAAMHDELAALRDALDAIPEVEPPSEMAAGVMRQVRQLARSAPVPIERHVAEGERKRKFAMRFALGLAAALAIGFVLLPSLRQPVEPGHAAGTMVVQPERTGPASEIPVRAGGITGRIRVSDRGDVLSLTFEFDAAAPRQIVVTFDPRVFSPISPPGPDFRPTGIEERGIRIIEVVDAAASFELRRHGAVASNLSLSIRQGDAVFETVINSGQSTNF